MTCNEHNTWNGLKFVWNLNLVMTNDDLEYELHMNWSWLWPRLWLEQNQTRDPQMKHERRAYDKILSESH